MEECDDGNDDNYDNCTELCFFPVCLDGWGQDGEQCDDGNRDEDDFCNNDCTFTKCGNGLMDDGEECDDANFNNNDGCSDSCKRENKSYVLPLAIGVPVVFLALAGLTFWKCTVWKEKDNKGRIINE